MVNTSYFKGLDMQISHSVFPGQMAIYSIFTKRKLCLAILNRKRERRELTASGSKQSLQESCLQQYDFDGKRHWETCRRIRGHGHLVFTGLPACLQPAERAQANTEAQKCGIPGPSKRAEQVSQAAECTSRGSGLHTLPTCSGAMQDTEKVKIRLIAVL